MSVFYVTMHVQAVMIAIDKIEENCMSSCSGQDDGIGGKRGFFDADGLSRSYDDPFLEKTL